MAQVELTVIEQSGVEVTVLDAPGAQVAIGPTLSTTTPEPVGLTGAAGTSSDAARADHVHAHGNQTGTSLHALATTSGAGFLSAAQFDLLDGATDQDSADTLVLRDASGDFEANNVYADLVGNAATATALATARTINGESFDGTNNITITAAPTAGSVVDASVDAAAAIALTKLATGALPTAITVASANIVDGTIVDADINASAAIALTKLATVTAGRVVMGNGSDVATATEITGDATLASNGVVTLSNSGVTPDTVNDSATSVTPITIDAKGRVTGTGSAVTITPSYNSLTDLPTTLAGYGITDAVGSADVRLADERVPTDGSVTDAKVSASAAIALSKLASITAGQVVLGNASNVATATALSGDVTISSSGVTAIGTGVIVNADISGSAAIALSKLATGALPTAITVASANIVDGTIVNADVSASAAIAGSKIAPDFGAQNVLTTGTITGASINPTGTAVPAAGLFRPATNVLAEATNSVERRRVTANGVYLFGQTVEPTGAAAGSIAAQGLYLGGGGNYTINQRISGGLLTAVTATTGTIIFRFAFADSVSQQSALVTLRVACASTNNTPSNHPSAEYAFVLHQTSGGVLTLNNQQSKYQFTFDIASHFAFNAVSSTECTVTLTNPTGVQLDTGSVYEVGILSRNGRFGLLSVTTT
jgi:hypothetical protein